MTPVRAVLFDVDFTLAKPGPELGHSKRDVLHRLDRLTSELGLDRDRALGWTVAQTVAWSGGSDYWDVHIDVVRWLLEDA